MEFKVNIGDPKTGKTTKKLLKDEECTALIGKKVGQTISGDALGHPGYEFRITGGSDYCGFPMRSDVEGTMRKRILVAGGVGFNSDRKGLRRRKNVAGNQIYQKTAQINLVVTKHGKAPLEPKAESPEGEAPEAKEEKKEKPKKEEKKEETQEKVKEEKPEKEEKKEETQEKVKEEKPEKEE